MEFFEKFKKSFKESNKFSTDEEKQKKLITLIGGIVLIIFVSAYVSGSFVNTVMSLLGEEKGVFYSAFFTPVGLIGTILLTTITCILIILVTNRKRLNNSVIVTDERGVSYMKNGSSGTSVWMDEEEARKAYNIGNVSDTDTTIYGQLTTDGNKVVSYKYPEFGGTGDQNLLLIGSPGTGKSYAYVRTEIIQSIVRGDSIVCTDPSGELQGTIALFAKNHGYKVQILNLLDPNYSDFWNCLNEVIDPETERLDSGRLNTFVDIYLKNCDGADDPFWFGASVNVLKATIGLTSWIREKNILDNFKTLYKKVSISLPKEKVDEYVDNEMVDMVSFVEVKAKILSAADESGFDLSEVQRLIDEIEYLAPKFTMREVFINLMDFKKKIEDTSSSAPINHPGKIAYTTYSMSTDQVKQSALVGTQLKMQLLSNEKLANVLSYDGIDLNEFNREKTIIFVIMSDKSNEMKPILSLFFSSFFKDVQETWDKYQQIADAEGTKNTCLKTTVMLDEFFSIGVIGGDPSSFGVTMSNSRKRQLHINIIVQGITQLEALYGPEVASTIKTCCGTNLFLGCNDEDTANYVANFMCGEATVLNERHGESQSIFGEFNSRFNDVQFSSSKRTLLTVEEAKSWNNKVLVSKRGYHPIRLIPFPWTDHPLAKEIEKSNIYERMQRVDKKVKEMNKQEREYKAKHNIDIEIKKLKTIKELSKPKISKNKNYEQLNIFGQENNQNESTQAEKSDNKKSDKKAENKDKKAKNKPRTTSNQSRTRTSHNKVKTQDMGSGDESII